MAFVEYSDDIRSWRVFEGWLGRLALFCDVVLYRGFLTMTVLKSLLLFSPKLLQMLYLQGPLGKIGFFHFSNLFFFFYPIS